MKKKTSGGKGRTRRERRRRRDGDMGKRAKGMG